MEKAKIKNLILLVLVLVNIFLLFIVISNGLQSSRSKNLRDESIRTVLQKNGITLGDIPLPEFVPSTVILGRNAAKEERRLTSFIGHCEIDDLGGNIFMYRSNRAIARFSGTGEMAVSFDPELDIGGKSPEKAAVSTLGKIGVKCSVDNSVTDESGQSSTVTLNCVYNGDTVFNSRLVCSFRDNRLVLIEGSRILDDVISKSVPESYPDAITILMNFLEYIGDSGQICKEISSIDFGYFMETAVIGECTLLPIWRITTDVGSFHFDALTGNLRQMAQQ